MTYHRDRPHDWRELAACAGKGELFESVDPLDHLEARTICGTCPALAFAGCQRLVTELTAELAKHDTTIAGTWAGELHGAPRRRGPKAKRTIKLEHGQCVDCHRPAIRGQRNGTPPKGSAWHAADGRCDACYRRRYREISRAAS